MAYYQQNRGFDSSAGGYSHEYGASPQQTPQPPLSTKPPAYNPSYYNMYEQHRPSAPPPDTKAWYAPRQYRDVWAMILFYLHLLAFLGLAGFSIKHFKDYVDETEIGSPTHNHGADTEIKVRWRRLIGIFLVAAATCLAMTVLYISAMRRFTSKMITASFWVYTIIVGAASASAFLTGNLVGGIVLLFLALLFVLFYFTCRSRIPFAKVMLRTVIDIMNQYPSTFFVAFLGTFALMAYMFLFSITVAGLTRAFPDRYGYPLAFTIFSLYWTTQVVKNVVHTTVAGVAATVYFYGQSNPDGSTSVSIRNPTSSSLKRSVTTSFGSIAFGSLIIALIQSLRTLVSVGRNRAAQERDYVTAFCLTCLEYVIEFIEELARYFNVYAFSFVAAYGMNYTKAAQRVWNLVKTRGVDTIINDSIVETVLHLGALAVGLVTGGLAFAFTMFFKVFYCVEGIRGDCTVWPLALVIGVLCLCLGYIVFSTMSAVITSMVSTTFVCLAENPETLRRTKPRLYQKVLETYPTIAFGRL